jgi:streptogramin lyase
MTVDAEGIVWLCSATVGRFDPQTETWQTAQVGGWTGCMADASDNGLLWMANGSGVVGVNRDTLQAEKNWPTAGSYGVSIDFEGYVWTVASGSNAHKIDPDSGQVWTYGGLVGAYTYSDMTGYALSNAGVPNG